MTIIIIIAIVIIICCMLSSKDMKKIDKENMDKFSKLGYHYIESLGAYYKGGIKNISINNNAITIILLQEGLNFDTGIVEKTIFFKNIKDISLQSQQHIQNQVSLGKLIVFGVLAFSMEGKTNTINDEYIVLNAIDEDGEYNVVMQPYESTKNQEMYNTLSTYKNKYMELSKESI